MLCVSKSQFIGKTVYASINDITKKIDFKVLKKVVGIYFFYIKNLKGIIFTIDF